MSDLGDAGEAVLGLTISGLVLYFAASVFKSTSLSGEVLIDFGFWAVLFLIAAVVLGGGVVVAGVASVLRGF